ncbi:hypothetical protein Tco_0826419 [Tanacetum coccineum]
MTSAKFLSSTSIKVQVEWVGSGLKRLRRFKLRTSDSLETDTGTGAFCSGSDQALRSGDGYADFENFGRLNTNHLCSG